MMRAGDDLHGAMAGKRRLIAFGSGGDATSGLPWISAIRRVVDFPFGRVQDENIPCRQSIFLQGKIRSGKKLLINPGESASNPLLHFADVLLMRLVGGPPLGVPLLSLTEGSGELI